MPNGSKHFFGTYWGQCIGRGADGKPSAFDLDISHGHRWERFARDHCECFAGQEERCPDTGRHHYQIYFKLRARHTFDWVRKEFQTSSGDDFWVKDAKSASASWDYCTKSDTRVAGGWAFTFGDSPAPQGHRTDLSALKRALDSGGLAEAFQSEFGSAIKYARGCQLYLSTQLEGHQRDHKTRVWFFHGTPGCGKSSLAHALAAHLGLKLYTKSCSEKWFDHYHPLEHRAVLLDDFTGWIPFNQLLNIMDRKQATVEIKGGTLPFLAYELFITSNVHWEHWYDWKNKVREALGRRIDIQWDGTWVGDIIPIPNGAAIAPAVAGQRPKCPVIEGGHLAFTPLYHGNGKWTFEEDDQIEIISDDEEDQVQVGQEPPSDDSVIVIE